MSSIPDSDLAPDTNYGNAFPEGWFWLDQVSKKSSFSKKSKKSSFSKKSNDQ